MIAYDKNPVRDRGEGLSELWWQGRQWAVTAYWLECRDESYVIEKKRLLQDAATFGWVAHMGGKNWADRGIPSSEACWRGREQAMIIELYIRSSHGT
jgi:hypothetical protein